MRKLVKLDEGGWLTEIDLKAMSREALTLRSYINYASEDEEKLFHYRKKVLPLVHAALEGTLSIPYKGDKPYSWRLMLDGLAPMLTDEFKNIYSAFMNRIAGSATWSAPSVLCTGNSSGYIPDIVVKDGERYEWVEFEN